MSEPLDANIYGDDKDNSTAVAEANRVLGMPKPTGDVWGEQDSRANSEGLKKG